MSVGNQPDAFTHLISARQRARKKLLGYLITARDDERRRIASELHAEPLRSMLSVATKLEALRGGLDTELHGEVQELERSVDDVVSLLRRLTYDLSVAVGEEPLEDAVQTRLTLLDDEHSVAHRLHVRIESEPAPRTRGAVLRILDEVLANVGRHARAGSVEVSIEAVRGVLIRVEDDGLGFDPADAPPGPRRMGLCVARQRAEAAGGWLRVDSARGKGTVVELFVPGC